MRTWRGLAGVDGGENRRRGRDGAGRADCRTPYTVATGSDGHLAAVLDAYRRHHPRAASPVWESYWTMDASRAGVNVRAAAPSRTQSLIIRELS